MHGRQIGFFVRVSVVHKFGPEFWISSLLVFGKIGLRIVFGDVLDRKYGFPDYKKIDFIWLPNLIIF